MQAQAHLAPEPILTDPGSSSEAPPHLDRTSQASAAMWSPGVPRRC